MQPVIESRGGEYRFTLAAPQIIALSQPPAAPLINDWITIGPNGVLWIKSGYAWDGCSIVPDGPRGSDGLPITWKASLIHDALYQYAIGNGTYTRAQADAFFREALHDCGFAFRGLYYVGVRLFGGLYHKRGDVPEPPPGA